MTHPPSKKMVQDWQQQAEKYEPILRRILAANRQYWKARFRARRYAKSQQPVDPLS